MEQTAIQSQQTGRGKKILFIGLAVAATGTLGYLGYQWWKQKSVHTDALDESSDLPSEDSFSPPVVLPKRNDDFPLKKGSKGARVIQLQEALIEKYGKQILPRYGADGDFGNEMVAALTKQNYPLSIDASTFNVIVKSGGLNAASLASSLYNAAIKKDFSAAIQALQKLKSKEDYSAVSESFKANYRIGGVRQTLVNGMLGSFNNESQKQAIRLQFTRMGLSYDGSKWSLSGLDTASLITKEPTLVWVNSKTATTVAVNTILGKELGKKGKYTLFENNDRSFLVETKAVKTI